jgi:hypothetical protein
MCALAVGRVLLPPVVTDSRGSGGRLANSMPEINYTQVSRLQAWPGS